MGALHLTGKLQCPYTMCQKTFEKPLVLTDNTQIVRETYYACPHCRSKIEIIVEDPSHPRLASVEGLFQTSQKAPTNCSHHLGYLRELPENAPLPDECSVCPKVMHCFIKKNGT
jgi:DNA-directed RNA polymerase subunit RPC12/RpoP